MTNETDTITDETEQDEPAKDVSLEELQPEYIDKAVDFAEASQKLADQHKKDKTLDEEFVELPVIGGDNKSDAIILYVTTGPDEYEEVSVPWPDDTRDPSEPLVRLANWYNVPIEDITQLNEVYVYTEKDELKLVIPPEPKTLTEKIYYKFPELFTRSSKRVRYNRVEPIAQIRRDLAFGVAAPLAATATALALSIETIPAQLEVMALFAAIITFLTAAIVIENAIPQFQIEI